MTTKITIEIFNQFSADYSNISNIHGRIKIAQIEVWTSALKLIILYAPPALISQIMQISQTDKTEKLSGNVKSKNLRKPNCIFLFLNNNQNTVMKNVVVLSMHH